MLRKCITAFVVLACTSYLVWTCCDFAAACREFRAVVREFRAEAAALRELREAR